MSQISQPVRIVLIAGVVFLVAWFTVLKPKPAEVEPATTTTSTTTTTTAPPASQTEAATTTAPTAPPETPAPAAIPAEELAKLPKDVADALKAKKVLVLGVLGDQAKPWRPLADDDRYVRNELSEVNTYDGGVFIKQVPAGQLSTYGALVNDLNVNQTPSIVVIGSDLKGAVITGYADRISINQVIADARDASTEPDITDPFLRDFNHVCGDFSLRVGRWSAPTISGKQADLDAVDRYIAIVERYRRSVVKMDAPKKWRFLKTDALKALDHQLETLAAARKAIQSGKPADIQAYKDERDSADFTDADRRADEAGVTNCVGNRRS